MRTTREAVSEISVVGVQTELTKLQRFGSALLNFIARFESNSWRHLPVVDSPEVSWGYWSDDELNRELMKLIDES